MLQPLITDKNIVKAVFKLHFNVTQMLQFEVEALVLSIVPEDIGKPSTRLEEAKVNGGVCSWENPVYETVKLVQEPKTGKFNERIYHFMLSNGLSKASSIGIVSIDFADYVEATKPSSISLPIKNSHCDAVLHVSIQRIQVPGDMSLCAEFSNGDIEERAKNDSSENVSAKSNTNIAELSVDFMTSSGSDITGSSSDVNYRLDIPRDGLRNTRIHLRANTSLSEPEKPTSNALVSMYDIGKESHLEWFARSELGSSADDSINVSSDALSKEMSQQASDIEIERLKGELAASARRVDMKDLELHALRKQIVKESKRRHELSEEINGLKEERDALKTECNNLRSFKNRSDEAKMSNSSQLESGDLRTLVEEIRQELNYEKDLNANLKLELKNAQISKAELVDTVQDLDDMLEHKNKEIRYLSNKHEQSKTSDELEGSCSKCEINDGNDDDDDRKGFEELVKQRNNADIHLLEQKIEYLYGEIEMYRRDKDKLEMHFEQIALDYEILKQESHDIAYKLEQSQLRDQLKMQFECPSPSSDIDEFEKDIKGLENQLEKQSEELSNSRDTIKEFESEIERIKEDMEKQAQGFKASLDAATLDKVEQEQRAIRAEEALRKNKQKNANTTERLQEQLRRLSVQMVSTFDADISCFSEKLEKSESLRTDLELMKKSVEEYETLLQRGMVERNELTSMIASSKKEAEQLFNELNRMRHVLDEKETLVRLLQSELEELKAQHSDLLNSLIEDEAEKDKLGIRVFELKDELKKDAALTNIDKRFKGLIKTKEKSSAWKRRLLRVWKRKWNANAKLKN